MSATHRFSTALREYTRKQIEQLGTADVVVGIPAYYSDDTIAHVIRQVAAGLERHYPELRCLVMVADGGSTDDTREVAQNVGAHQYNFDIITTIYRGIPGKGSAFRAVFEAARFLQARAVAVFDSDLRSITHQWVKNILDPVFRGYDFVAPDYLRYKFDGTITNTIAYNLTRALYGVNIRQPIGGDFGLSLPLVKHYLDHDVWESEIAKFGVDIWMTTSAVTGGFKICQARLGAKIHGEKDPAADLGPMFRQVVGTIFRLMEENVSFWRRVDTVTTPPTFGDAVDVEPPPFEIDVAQLVDYFQLGFQNFGPVWRNIVDPQDFPVIESLAQKGADNDFDLPGEAWVRIVYRYARTFCRTPRQRMKVLDTMIPLYNARVASLVTRLRDKDQAAAEAYYDAQADLFLAMKPYLLALWDEEG
ncbi:MAG TPA: glycosyltransferase [Desulfobacterales bacterium]|nr:glycosyltransferase [Desulfobacterales bacterium]